MSYIPGFEYDLFVSYASGDNDQGAIEDFVNTVEKQIADNLVNWFSPQEKVRVYLDRQRLAPQTAVNWHEQLRGAASSSAIFVPLLSPNYLSSHFCDKERIWFTAQPHVNRGSPFALVGWLPTGNNPLPVQFDKMQRHPATADWLALMPAERRIQSAKDFALKLRDAINEMRTSISAVFLGPAVGRGIQTRSRLRDELEKSGHRVIPNADYEYQDTEDVRAQLKSALLSIHFPGDGLDLDGLKAIEESFLLAGRTLLVLPSGSTLSSEEIDLLAEVDSQLASGGRFAGKAYTKLQGKSDDVVWEAVKREVRTARFLKHTDEYAVGVACEAQDLLGAKAIALLITQLGVPAQYPAFDTAVTITEKLQALRNTITQSQALICYWAKAEGKGLERRLEQDARRRYKAKAWYLAPPLDVPAKERLFQTSELVLHQKAADVDLETLEPFLRELGWTPAL